MTVPVRSATEYEIRGKMEERTRWRGQNESQIVREEKRNGRLVGAVETSKERVEWRRLQRKNLNIFRPAEKERVASVPQREQLARQEPPLPKGKGTEPSVQSTRSCGEGKESRWARAAPWRERRESEREHEEERVDSTVKEGRFQRGK